MKISWANTGINEKGYDAAGRCIVAIDSRYFRPAEVDTLLGDATKARSKLGWRPRVGFRELVAEMARQDLAEAERESLVKRHGFRSFDHHE
jgi:GDPmannose 4,6-dehydratase